MRRDFFCVFRVKSAVKMGKFLKKIKKSKTPLIFGTFSIFTKICLRHLCEKIGKKY